MQASGPGKRGGRAFGTRDRVVACLLAQGDVRDSSGMASPKLAEAVGYPGSSIAFAQLLSGMERSGLITREVRGKRTYRVHLTASGRERARLVAAEGTQQAPERERITPVGSGGTHRPGRPAVPQPAPRAGSGTSDDGGRPDYDELAHRLLAQVARRLLASPEESPAVDARAAAPEPGPVSGTAPGRYIDTLEEKVATLERELARAKAARNELRAENEDLREQLARIRDNLDQFDARPRPPQRAAHTDRLDQQEIALLQRLLATAPTDEGGSRASTA